KQPDRKETAKQDDHLALKERLPNSDIGISGMTPTPNNPRKGLIQCDALHANQWKAQCGLISELGSDVLRSHKAYKGQRNHSDCGRFPLVVAQISGCNGFSVKLRFFHREIQFEVETVQTKKAAPLRLSARPLSTTQPSSAG